MNEDNLKENIFPFVIDIEFDEETELPIKKTYADFYEAEKEFANCRRIYNCKIEFYEQNMNENVVKIFATYYGS